MADQVIPNVNRIFDANGIPAAGAMVHVYLQGTSTPISVWSDQAGTVAIANPVEADGNGYVPQFYVEDAARVLVKDSTGAVIYEMDPVPQIVTPTLAAVNISFTSTTSIPFNTVQDAIVGVDTSWRAAVDAIGIGDTGSPALDADLDAGAAASGFTYYDATTLGTPPTGLALSAGGTVARYRENASNMRQVITGNNPVRHWVRDLKDGSWTAWREVVNIPRTVANGDMFYRGSAEMVLLNIGTEGQVLRVNDESAPVWADGWYQVATGQTITTAGTLTLPHSLGAAPRALAGKLTCTTGEHGHSIGAVIECSLTNNSDATTSRHNALTLTATNIIIRFASAAEVFTAAHATTGASVALTNANWTLAVYASL